jgi:hypothetical protein
MTPQQQSALLDLCQKKISEAKFLSLYGITREQIPSEISASLKQALENQDSDLVEYTLMLNFSFDYPADVGLLNELVAQPWHISHEDIIRLLQNHRSPSSVNAIRKAIELKPTLDYLDYDDYGSYYKKCLWALSDIGTLEAITLIKECTASPDEALRNEAEYRLGKRKMR